MRTYEAAVPQVVTARRGAAVTEIARLMREGHVGSVVVVDDASRPVGIVTDRDLVVEVLAAELDPRTVNVDEIMAIELVTAREDDDALDTLKRMRRAGVRRVPVVDAQGRLTGLVALDDLLEVAGGAIDDVLVAIRSERTVEAARRY